MIRSLILFTLIHGFGSCSALAADYFKSPGYLISDIETTVSSGTPKQLTKNSSSIQVITGSASQSIALPDATTLPNGRWFEFTNKSLGYLSIGPFGGGLARTLSTGETVTFRLRDNSDDVGTWVWSNGLNLGAMSIDGALGITNGGTGQTSANAAFNALAPAQTGHSGKFLTTNGTNTSWASASVTTKGQSEVSSVSTLNIEVPHNQMTTTATDTRLIETGNDNILANPSFESSTVGAGWIVDSNFSASLGTSGPRHGSKYLILDSSGAFTGNVACQEFILSQDLTGKPLEHKISIRSTDANYSACAIQNGSVYGACLPIIPGSNWSDIVLTSVGGPAATSYGVCVKASGATADLHLDNAYVGDNKNIGTVAQAESILKVIGNNSTQSIGDNSITKVTNWNELEDPYGAFSSGTFTAPKAGTLQIKSAIRWATITTPVRTTITIYKNGAAAKATQQSGEASPTNLISTSITVAQNDTIEVYAYQDSAGSANIDGAPTAQFLEIDYVPSSSQTVVRMDQSNFGLTDWTPTVTGLGTVTVTRAKYRREGEMLFGEVRITGGTATATSVTFTLPTGIALDYAASQFLGTGNTTNTSNPDINVIWDSTGATNIITLANAQTGTNGFGVLTGTTLGNNVTLSFTFKAKIVGWTENQNAPLLAGGVTSSSAGMERTERVSMGNCSTTPCAIASKSGDWVTSITRSTTGTYTLNIISGIFSATPTCVIQNNENAARITALSSASPTAIGFIVATSSAGSLTDSGVNILCQGPR